LLTPGGQEATAGRTRRSEGPDAPQVRQRVRLAGDVLERGLSRHIRAHRPASGGENATVRVRLKRQWRTSRPGNASRESAPSASSVFRVKTGEARTKYRRPLGSRVETTPATALKARRGNCVSSELFSFTSSIPISTAVQTVFFVYGPNFQVSVL
jgi:hypothetical protein